MLDIEILGITSHEGEKSMELRHTEDYLDFPLTIKYLGDTYRRTSWNSDRKIVTYKTS